MEQVKKYFLPEHVLKGKFADFHSIKLNEVLFFGDKIYPGGNDFTATMIVDCVKVKAPEDTLRKLREIYLENKEYDNSEKTMG